MSYYAYSSWKCEHSAATEVNNSCKSAASHSIFVHKYSTRPKNKNKNKIQGKIINHSDVHSILSLSPTLRNSPRGFVCCCHCAGMGASKGQGEGQVLIEGSAIYTRVTSTVSLDLSFPHKYKHKRIHKLPLYSSTCHLAIDRFPRSQSLQRWVSDLLSPSISSITVQSNLILTHYRTVCAQMPWKRIHQHSYHQSGHAQSQLQQCGLTVGQGKEMIDANQWQICMPIGLWIGSDGVNG